MEKALKILNMGRGIKRKKGVQKGLLFCTGYFPFSSGYDCVYSAVWGKFM
jgi:hypothetical protein